MNRCSVFLMACTVFLSVRAEAQHNAAPGLGTMSIQQFNASEALRGGDADAVVIYRNGRYSFIEDEDFMSGLEPFPIFRMEIVTRVKILSAEGTRYGIFEFPYHNFSSNVPIIEVEGFTYNMDDNGAIGVTPLGKEDMQDMAVNGNDRLKRIVFPNVREGSVVELRCVQRMKYSRMPVWNFQQDIPVLSSELVYTASPFLGYSSRLKGADRCTYTDRRIVKGEQRAAYVTDPDHIVYTWGMNNMPAYPTEDYTNNAQEDLIRMVFDLVSRVSSRNGAVLSVSMTWPKVNDALTKNRDFGRYMKAAEKEYAKIKDLPADRSVTGIGEAVFRYVRDNYRWNGVSSPYASQRASEFVKKKTGNSADINLFLVGLLRGAGVEAVPVLLNRRGSGAIDKEMPSEEGFNYVVVSAVIDGAEYFLDATEEWAKFGELPARSANVEGLYMVPGSERWAFTFQDQFSYDERIADATVDVPGAVMDAVVSRSFDGNAAVNMRSEYAAGNFSVAEMLGGSDGIAVQELSVENAGNADMPFIVKYKYSQPVTVDDDGNIAIVPLWMLAPEKNQFTGSGMRRFRVDMPFRPMDRYEIRITVPEGYRVAELPRSVTVNDDISFFKYSTSQEDGTVRVEAEYYLCKSNYPPSSYVVLKNRYDNMIATLQQKIVFVPAGAQ